MRYLVSSVALCLTVACFEDHKGPVQAAPPETSAKKTGASSAKAPTTDVTATDQTNVQADLDLTQRVRRTLVDDSTLSTAAKNITIVSKSGVVALRGDVASTDEHARVKSMVVAVEGVKEIDDQLAVKAQ